MILIVDSWAWLAILEKGLVADKILVHIKDSQESCYTTVLNLYEVYYRVLESSDEKTAREYIELIRKNARVISLDEEIAILAAKVHLKEKLPAVDAFVYTLAIKLNGKVITGDPHFRNKKEVIFIE